MSDYQNIKTTDIEFRSNGKTVAAKALALRIVQNEYQIKILINGEIKRISPACLINPNQFRGMFKKMECNA